MIDFLSKLKGIAFLLAIFVVWLVFIVFTPFGWFQVVLVIICLVVNGLMRLIDFATRRFWWYGIFILLSMAFQHWIKSWCFTLWLSNDQYINTLFGGREDHSISGRVGVRALANQKVALVMEKIINFPFYVIFGQRDHCRQSIEWDEVPAWQR